MLLFWGTCSGTSLRATGAADSLRLDLTRDLADQLLPFEEIYGLALRFSPVLKEETGQAEAKALSIPQAKLDIFQGLSLTGAYTMGNQALISNGSSSFEAIQVSNGYRGGVQVSLQLATLLNRRSRVRQAEAGYRSALARTETVKLGLRRELSKVYQEMLTAQRVLAIYLQEEQTNLVVFRKSELEWQSGRSTAEEYASASALYHGTRVKVETARGGFITSFNDLLALTGVEVSQLKR